MRHIDREIIWITEIPADWEEWDDECMVKIIGKICCNNYHWTSRKFDPSIDVTDEIVHFEESVGRLRELYADYLGLNKGDDVFIAYDNTTYEIYAIDNSYAICGP